MNIALCLHGLFNSNTDITSLGMDGYDHISKHILTGNKVDVFIHSWQPEKRTEINNLYNPLKFKYEPQINFDRVVQDRNLNTLEGCPRPPQTILSHFYSIQESFKLCYDHGIEYDIVIKSRFDLGRINRNTSVQYPVQCINFNKDLDMNFLYMADWQRFHNGPADMWFYSSYHNMKNFTHIYNDLLNNFYINSKFHKFAFDIERNVGDLSNAVIFFKYWFMLNGLWDKKRPLECQFE